MTVPVHSAPLPFVTADEVRRRISVDTARELIAAQLRAGFDPADDPHRIPIDAGSGHLLLMPSVLGQWVGVKIASVAPGNPDRGLPRIQATYMLMDADTLTPRLLVDGSALTELRTPATSAVACDRLAAEDARTLVVFGTGPQAIEHVVALDAIRDLAEIRIIGRSRGRLTSALEILSARGITAEEGRVEDVPDADIVVCATSASRPLFDASLVSVGTCVIAMGSHEPDLRELPGALLSGAQVVVEDRAAAMREAGDIVLAVDEGHLSVEDLVPLADLVRGRAARDPQRVNVFKGTGMSWQDLAVASGLMTHS
ncbi:ornithine cyclodeaminase [Brevibacterium sanguinis]|uniref:Ornithine cyclodeaminase n=2 Tax=Brevibacterium TaxID=1696 RepID=A0A366IRB2_9MICO|nr:MULTISPECIES: ornithine cyclodeaminase family protein [Brevibacterium]RBP68063.1 ornithine cyclodeaminase [Brevibacterium sanguinis]RBP74520.1 ornithine cyclodeaminase [Brevibacterium celere]